MDIKISISKRRIVKLKLDKNNITLLCYPCNIRRFGQNVKCIWIATKYNRISKERKTNIFMKSYWLFSFKLRLNTKTSTYILKLEIDVTSRQTRKIDPPTTIPLDHKIFKFKCNLTMTGWNWSLHSCYSSNTKAKQRLFSALFTHFVFFYFFMYYVLIYIFKFFKLYLK